MKYIQKSFNRYMLFFALAFLCGCKEELGRYSSSKSGDSEIYDLNLKNDKDVKIKVIMVTHPDGYTNKAWCFNFVMAAITDADGQMSIFDFYCRNWDFFPKIYAQDVNGDGEEEIIVIIPKELSPKIDVINIYRHFPYSKSGDPYFMALESSICFRGSYEFKDGKLIVVDRYDYDPDDPDDYIGTRVYRIEQHKVVLESGEYDWRVNFFRYPVRKESEWLELKAKYEK